MAQYYIDAINNYDEDKRPILRRLREEPPEFCIELFSNTEPFTDPNYALYVGWLVGFYNGNIYPINFTELDVADVEYDNVEYYGVLKDNTIYPQLTPAAVVKVDKINIIKHAAKLTPGILRDIDGSVIIDGYLYYVISESYCVYRSKLNDEEMMEHLTSIQDISYSSHGTI